MTRMALITLLLLSSAPAYAERVRIGENDRSVAWADTAIRRSGEMVEMWVQFDYKSIQASPRRGKQYFRKRHSMKSITDLSVNGCCFSPGMLRNLAMALPYIPEENLLPGTSKLSRELCNHVLEVRLRQKVRTTSRCFISRSDDLPDGCRS